jgi:hypothetical protein
MPLTPQRHSDSDDALISEDASEDDGDEDDDPDFGSSAKRKPQKSKAAKKGLSSSRLR